MELCRFSHDPASKSRGDKQGGGGASGDAHKKAKATGSAASAASTSGDGEGSSRGEALPNSPPVPTNVGAGSAH